jgi:membrane-bound lytic murein transglycosylase A
MAPPLPPVAEAKPAPEVMPVAPPPAPEPRPAPEVKPAAPPPLPEVRPVPQSSLAAAPAGNALAAPTRFSGDPSFVFFRQIRDYDGGPIGALGVPLTPQRSVAVDPRTTPLGMPVYLVAADGGEGGGLRRLMVAQDTGGAIRGAVRADFFWGFGPQAGQRASQTRLLARMWVLMPKSITLAAAGGAVTTRGVGRGIIDLDAECVVADADLCVE